MSYYPVYPQGNKLPTSFGSCTCPSVTCNNHLLLRAQCCPLDSTLSSPTLTHWVTPPKLLSTTKAVIFSFTAPVAASLIGVLAKTVKTSAMPPLLWKKEAISKWCGLEQRGQEIGLKG